MISVRLVVGWRVIPLEKIGNTWAHPIFGVFRNQGILGLYKQGNAAHQ
jgi:hypothetical protein